MARGNIPVGRFYASYPSDCTYELNSSPGNSGGPVFAKPVFVSYGDKPRIDSKLIGMVSGYLPYRDTAYSRQTGRPKIVFEENSGLAEVVPIDAIQKTISLAVSRYGEDTRGEN